MLAVWRAHGLDTVLTEAWAAGIVLAGMSAGAICWFEASVTDSFGPTLAPLNDGLRLLPGSCCPHYDGEPLRRPTYQRLVASGFPAGYAVDDAAALVFEGTDLVEVVASTPDARAYRVTLEPRRRRRDAAPGALPGGLIRTRSAAVVGGDAVERLPARAGLPARHGADRVGALGGLPGPP